MASKIKDFLDDVYDAMATGESNSLLSQSPFYDYGDKNFLTNEGNPPQHRWRKTDVSIMPRLNSDNPTWGAILNTSGSYGIWKQGLECTIWAADETAVFEEFELICKYIASVASHSLNSTGLQQVTPLMDGTTGEWVDSSDYSIDGEMFRFNYDLAININKENIGSTMILTASIGVSASLDGGNTYIGGLTVISGSS